MAIPFSKFTVSNGAITDLRELLFATLYNDPDIERVVTTQTSVVNGKKLGLIYGLGDVGNAGGGCDPQYKKAEVLGAEKAWDLGEWEIPIELCYAELENTLAKYGMNSGTAIGDLQDTPYWDQVLMPSLQNAMIEMFWRMIWFGDKDAKHITDSGIITDEIDLTLLNMCDGLWKRLKVITAANSDQLTKIAANEAATYLEQKEAIRKDGVAVDIVDSMIADCDSRIFDDPNSAIYMTSSLFKALRNDVKRLHNLQLEVEHVSAGIQLSRYDGYNVVVLDIWDRLIRKFENNGTKLNAPHRAIISTPNNLFAGTSDTKRVADLDVFFDDKTRKNHIYVRSDIDTQIGQDELVQVAM